MILQFPEKKEPDAIVEGLVLRATTQKKEIKTQAEQIDALVKRLELKLKDQNYLEYFKMKNVKHYKKDGTLFTGNTHKMPNGSLHSGKTHGKTSVKLFHFNELSKKSQRNAK